MRVLSIIEPFGTLIAKKVKFIETRGYKTSYRGELYIHASKTKMANTDKDLLELISQKELNYGLLVCKCKLVDCVYMTKEYVEKIQKEKPLEYRCGDYQVGRYAWILEDILELSNKIPIKGQLGIFDFYEEDKILEYMQDIEYGYMTNKKKLKRTFETMDEDYFLQSPKEVQKNKLGVCFDQVELERYLLKNACGKVDSWAIIYKSDNEVVSHTFLTYQKDNKNYWIENAWEKYKGKFVYQSLKDLITDVKNKFIKDQIKTEVDINYLKIYNYKKPKRGMSVTEFFKHIQSGELYE